MSSQAGNTSSAYHPIPGTSSTPPTGKWVPRWKQNPNAVPSVRLYYESEIKKAVPGEDHSHTFTRALADSSAAAAPTLPAEGAPKPEEPALAEHFCRIMVHDKAHLNPPHELWTRNNIEQLELNVGKPLPLFMEAPAKRRSFEFLGWYQIKSWARCPGGGKDVRAFIEKRQISQTARTREYWESALSEDWARVVLEKVNDPSLGNPMEKSA